MTSIAVLTNCPDAETAEHIANAVVAQRLAACVNILPPCRSLYHWEGKVEQAVEVPLLIKTTSACYDALEAAIRALHPYQIPEIVALPVAHGLPAYLQWVADETRPER